MSLHKDVSFSNTKAEERFKKENKTSDRTARSAAIEIQHQPVQQEPNTKILTDLVKRMEDIEKAINSMNRYRTDNTVRSEHYRGKKPSMSVNKQQPPSKKLGNKDHLNM